jgi:TRAP-type mannitol/chloroaromatic compound transport system permease small subunit
MVIIQLTIVMARYIFGVGFLKLQELLIYLHGLSFTLAAGYTLLSDEHVRVDLIYRASSDKYKSVSQYFRFSIFLNTILSYYLFDKFSLCRKILENFRRLSRNKWP